MHHRVPLSVIRAYLMVALAAAAVVSPLALSFVPVLFAGWYVFQRVRPLRAMVGLVTELTAFFAVAVLLSARMGAWGVVPALPLLLLVGDGLRAAAASVRLSEVSWTSGRRPTMMLIVLAADLAALAVIGLMVSNLALVLASLAGGAYVVGLGVRGWRTMGVRALGAEQIEHQVVAGSDATFDIELKPEGKWRGRVGLQAVEGWAAVSPAEATVAGGAVKVQLSVSPTLSGPTVVKLKGTALEEYGAWTCGFDLAPARLIVIPRAKYAAWLAARYLEGGGGGTLALPSAVASIKPSGGLRRGVEYYGSQVYQPGDSLKHIDWKHSLQENELISKEFWEYRGNPAVLLVNLVASGAEEADKLAFNLITTALTLARENIPAAFAAYTGEKVGGVTGLLSPNQVLTRALAYSREVVVVGPTGRVLDSPDVGRLLRNISRLGDVGGEPAAALSGLLKIELESIKSLAKSSPATRALALAMKRVGSEATVVVISGQNHDAEALAYIVHGLRQKGGEVVEVGPPSQRRAGNSKF